MELWAADPEHNGTAAAKGAGYSGKDHTLAQQASRLLTRAKVRAAIERISKKAMALAEERTNGAILTLAQALENASAIAEVDVTACLGDDGELDAKKLRDLPPAQRKCLAVELQSTTNEDGQVFARQKVKRDPVALQANKLLIEHHSGLTKNPGENQDATRLLSALKSLPDNQLLAIMQALRSATARDVTPRPAA